MKEMIFTWSLGKGQLEPAALRSVGVHKSFASFERKRGGPSKESDERRWQGQLQFTSAVQSAGAVMNPSPFSIR